MPHSSLEYLRHIADETEYIISTKKNLSHQDFLKDETIKRAFIRSIEIIGEATKKISQECKNKYSDLEWRSMAGMRDKLIHDYFGVDYDIVWDVVENKIPILNKKMKAIINDEENL